MLFLLPPGRGPPALYFPLLVRIAHEYFVEHGLFVFRFAQDTSEQLNILARASRSVQNNRDLRERQINGFVHDSRGDNSSVLFGLETVQDFFSLSRVRMMSQYRDQIAVSDSIRDRVGFGKDQIG